MALYRCEHCGGINRVPAAGGKVPVCGRCKQRLDTGGAPQDVDGAGLQAAVRSGAAILLDVWAPWCGPCRVVGPIVEQIGRARAGELLVLKLNSDGDPQAAGALGIRGIPTLILFDGKREVARQSGAAARPALEAWIDRYLPATRAAG